MNVGNHPERDREGVRESCASSSIKFTFTCTRMCGCTQEFIHIHHVPRAPAYTRTLAARYTIIVSEHIPIDRAKASSDGPFLPLEKNTRESDIFFSFEGKHTNCVTFAIKIHLYL